MGPPIGMNLVDSNGERFNQLAYLRNINVPITVRGTVWYSSLLRQLLTVQFDVNLPDSIEVESREGETEFGLQDHFASLMVQRYLLIRL